MTNTPHELAAEFPDKADLIHRLKTENAHFARLAEEYHEINRQVHRAETLVDGNVERVIARLFAVETPMPRAKPRAPAAAGLSCTRRVALVAVLGEPHQVLGPALALHRRQLRRVGRLELREHLVEVRPQARPLSVQKD